MVSDSELVGRLREFLSTSDLNTTSNAAVRRKLEEDFGIDLSDRKVFIRDQIDLYLESEFQNEKNEEEMEEENDEGPSAEVKSEVSEEEEDPEEEEEEEVEESESVAKGKRKSSKKKYVFFKCMWNLNMCSLIFILNSEWCLMPYSNIIIIDFVAYILRRYYYNHARI